VKRKRWLTGNVEVLTGPVKEDRDSWFSISPVRLGRTQRVIGVSIGGPRRFVAVLNTKPILATRRETA
jgi:hypothetical protein